ncbi:hypothetical protein [Chryseobacterium lathyri]|uniref:SGNH/GDSL hydrolase family protein n=1 Tax=Chryseobacterium lathyri TaxID=395933 RepID=A0ABT9SG74_9FLAO|nr:hypothetical protein [Chryseobacterium lathyri]MDP9958424.1 hypothetical protein [Chryseobacterium lathyri]
MKKFLFKISLYIIGLITVFLFLGSYGDGNTDDNYLQFVRQGDNIIMGDSRGAQAIIPDTLEKNFPGHVFDNFSLNITYSPYGEIYLKGLKRKIKPNTKNGIFILTVDPWNVSNAKNSKSFPEEHSALNNMWFYNLNPNYEYLVKNYHKSWFLIYRDRAAQGKSNTFLHDNGWLEVTVDVSPEKVAEREMEKVTFYRDVMATSQEISPVRLKYFEETIQFLNQHGKVYLVRIPGGVKVNEIEQKYAPHFNQLMKEIAQRNHASYFDFCPLVKSYTFTDGNHLYKESGKILTKQIADSIKKVQKL